MNPKKFLIIFLLILILSGIIFRFSLMSREFIGEETDFVKPAEAIRDTGYPVFYHSEQRPLETALWHPPIYIFLMSFILRFIPNEIGARSINIIFSLLTTILIFLFCIKTIEKEKGFWIGLISSAFFIINYYILSSSFLIDIDVLSMFFVFGFVSSIVLYSKFKKNCYLWLAGTSFFFSLANRYPIAIIVYFFIGIYYFFNEDLRSDFKKYLVTGVFSGLIFVLVWFIYSTFIEPGNFFSFIIHNTKLGTEQFSSLVIYLGSFVLNISQFIRLVTFPAVILMLWTFYELFKTKSKLIKIILIYVLSIFFFFLLVPRPAFGYPRYFLTMFPGVSILIGIFLYINLRETKSINKEVIFGVLSFLASLVILIILNPQATIYSSDGLIKATNLPDFIFNLLASIPLLFIFLFKENKKRMIIFILISLILSYSLYFNIKLVTYDGHIKETADYIKQRTNESDIIIVPKTIGYYSERKFYINENTKPKLDFSTHHFLKYIKNSFKIPNMDNEFFWSEGLYSGIYEPHPLESELKNNVSYIIKYNYVEGQKVEKKIGKFYIYKV